MVSDLADSSAAGHPLDGLLFGGASAPDWLAKRAREAFPAAMSYVQTDLLLPLPSYLFEYFSER